MLNICAFYCGYFTATEHEIFDCCLVNLIKLQLNDIYATIAVTICIIFFKHQKRVTLKFSINYSLSWKTSMYNWEFFLLETQIPLVCKIIMQQRLWPYMIFLLDNNASLKTTICRNVHIIYGWMCGFQCPIVVFNKYTNFIRADHVIRIPRIKRFQNIYNYFFSISYQVLLICRLK